MNMVYILASLYSFCVLQMVPMAFPMGFTNKSICFLRCLLGPLVCMLFPMASVVSPMGLSLIAYAFYETIFPMAYSLYYFLWSLWAHQQYDAI